MYLHINSVLLIISKTTIWKQHLFFVFIYIDTEIIQFKYDLI